MCIVALIIRFSFEQWPTEIDHLIQIVELIVGAGELQYVTCLTKRSPARFTFVQHKLQAR